MCVELGAIPRLGNNSPGGPAHRQEAGARDSAARRSGDTLARRRPENHPTAIWAKQYKFNILPSWRAPDELLGRFHREFLRRTQVACAIKKLSSQEQVVAKGSDPGEGLAIITCFLYFGRNKLYQCVFTR